jgi:hypothetical protein
MIVDINGKKYVEKSDIDFSKCPITEKLNRISKLAELSYMNCERYTEEDTNKKSIFGNKKPDKESLAIAKSLGILEEPHFKKAIALLKEVQTEIEDTYVDLITVGNYHKGPEYKILLNHYKDLRLQYWRCVSLVANYKLATELTPIFAWL